VNTPPSPRVTGQPPPSVVQALLLPNLNSVDSTIPAECLDPAQLTVKVTTVTVLLKEMLDQNGYRHGGIND
jgi:hypothetical protein